MLMLHPVRNRASELPVSHHCYVKSSSRCAHIAVELLSGTGTSQTAKKFSSTTTSPEAVQDEAYITAKEALTLHYIEGSAKIYNHWHQDGHMLSTELFSPEGVHIGAEDMNGVIIYGGDKFSGSVGYLFETKAIEGDMEDSEVKESSEINSTENGTDSSESSDKHNTTGKSKGAVTVITVLVILVIILIAVIMKLLNRFKK